MPLCKGFGPIVFQVEGEGQKLARAPHLCQYELGKKWIKIRYLIQFSARFDQQVHPKSYICSEIVIQQHINTKIFFFQNQIIFSLRVFCVFLEGFLALKTHQYNLVLYAFSVFLNSNHRKSLCCRRRFIVSCSQLLKKSDHQLFSTLKKITERLCVDPMALSGSHKDCNIFLFPVSKKRSQKKFTKSMSCRENFF